MAPGSRNVGTLSRNIRPRSGFQAIYAVRSSKRCMAVAADSNPLSQHEFLPPSMAVPPQQKSPKNIQKKTASLEVEPEEIRPPRAVQLAYLAPLKRTPKHRIPTCNLQLRSYSVRNLEFFATFALRAAYFLNLPAVGPVPLPRIVERWTVPKGHFVHKKSQENFERITMRRLIQIQDGHPETVQMWLAYLQKRQYYGVGMKANVWQFEKLGLGKQMDATAASGESLEQRWTSQFPSQMTPELQSEVDAWMEQHKPGFNKVVPMKNIENSSAEERSKSAEQRIDEILAQIEREATVAEAEVIESSKVSNPVQMASSAAMSSQAGDVEEVSTILGQDYADIRVSHNADAIEQLSSSPESSIMQGTVAAVESESTTTGRASSSGAQISQNLGAKSESELASINSIPPPEPLTTQETKSVEEPLADSTSGASVIAEGSSDESISTIEATASKTPEPAMSTPPETSLIPDAAAAASSPATNTGKKSTAKKVLKSTTKRSAKTATKKAFKSEESTPPQPSDVDTSKDVSTPEEADPSVKPQTEEAKEAEKEDAQQPLGDLPKTPS